MSNELQWPSIPHFIDVFARQYEQSDDMSFLDDIITVTEKYDGTNVAIAASGTIYGRRHRIDTPKYNSVQVDHLRQVDVQGLAKDIGMEEAKNFRLYGELMCNPKGVRQMSTAPSKNPVFGQWYCFGAMMKDGERIVLDAKLRAALEKRKIPCVPLLFQGRLRDFLRSWPILRPTLQEGVVISWERHLSKLKIPCLTTLFCFNVLSECVRKIPDAEKSKTDLLAMIHSGAMAIDDRHASKRTQPLSVFESMLESALTKYDTLDSYFVTPEKRNKITQCLIDEILGEEEAATHKPAAITKFVKKYVGHKYGKWRVAQA